MDNQNKYNIHHIVWQCNESRCNVDCKDNLVLFNKIKHDWLNRLFQTLQSPHEQLWYLRWLYNTVLSETAKNLYDELLSLDKKQFYKKRLLR